MNANGPGPLEQVVPQFDYCPECEGAGWIEPLHGDPDHDRMERCPVCHGERGKVFEIPTWPAAPDGMAAEDAEATS